VSLVRGDLPSPWPRITTFALFVVAFLIALAKGTTLGAVIVAVVAFPSAIYVFAWLFTYARGGRTKT
jgi:hypothetical protein